MYVLALLVSPLSLVSGALVDDPFVDVALCSGLVSALGLFLVLVLDMR